MSNQLQQRIEEFTGWRTQLVGAIDEFRDWQSRHGNADIEQTLRLYDLLESLRNVRIRLAFLGESAPSKISLINALLFSDLPDGLLPQGAGSEFLCPTELFYEASEPPSIRLLPIDTRLTQNSIASLRRSPIEWITIRVEPDSPESVKEAMASLIQTRTVTGDEAKNLNFQNLTATEGAVTIPAFRYALVNLPRPILKSGLAALYTPTSDALAAEPEVALRMAASAQSLIIVLDSVLSASAKALWEQYLQGSRAQKFALLHPELADQEHREELAQALGVSQETMVTVSFSEESDSSRLLNQPTAGIDELQRLHAEKLIPQWQTQIRESIVNEIGLLVQAARQAVASRFIATIKEMHDLTSLSGESMSASQEILSRLEEERKSYQHSVSAFEATYGSLMARGQELLATLHDDRIEVTLTHDKEFIEGAWTTAGMWRNMQGLFVYFTEQVTKILNYASELNSQVDRIYQSFHENFGLPKLNSPRLSLADRLNAMQALEGNARRFCHNPLNIASYKAVLVKKFYDGLVEEARNQFEFTRFDTEQWLRGALLPLNVQIRERQNLMLKRVENLRNLKENLSSVKLRFKQLDEQRLSLKDQGLQLDRLRLELGITPPGKTTVSAK